MRFRLSAVAALSLPDSILCAGADKYPRRRKPPRRRLISCSRRCSRTVSPRARFLGRERRQDHLRTRVSGMAGSSTTTSRSTPEPSSTWPPCQSSLRRLRSCCWPRKVSFRRPSFRSTSPHCRTLERRSSSASSFIIPAAARSMGPARLAGWGVAGLYPVMDDAPLCGVTSEGSELRSRFQVRAPNTVYAAPQRVSGQSFLREFTTHTDLSRSI